MLGALELILPRDRHAGREPTSKAGTTSSPAAARSLPPWSTPALAQDSHPGRSGADLLFLGLHRQAQGSTAIAGSTCSHGAGRGSTPATTADDHVRTEKLHGLFWSGNFSLALGGLGGGGAISSAMFDPAEAVTLLERERVTSPYCWPHQWAQLEAAPGWAEADLRRLLSNPGRTCASRRRPSARAGSSSHASYGSTDFLFILTSSGATSEAVWKGNNGEVCPAQHGAHCRSRQRRDAEAGRDRRGRLQRTDAMLGYALRAAEEAFDEQGYYRTGDEGLIDEADRLVFQGWTSTSTGEEQCLAGGSRPDAVQLPGVKVCKTTARAA